MKWCEPFLWTRYSIKLSQKIMRPRNGGQFLPEEAEARKLHFATGSEGAVEDGNQVVFYWLVDPEDGVIVDAKFSVFGHSALIGACDAACDLLAGKNYDQAKRLSADLIDKQLRDQANTAAFPKETYPHLNMVLSAIENAAEMCAGLPLAESYSAPPAPTDIGETLEGGYPGWDGLQLAQKLGVIEEVLDREVRPYIALDGGGIEVVNLVHEKELVIRYQGNCTSCFSAIGATLSYIQQVIKAKVHPDIQVVPDL